MALNKNSLPGLIVSAIILLGCHAGKPKVSTSVDELRTKITLDVPGNAVKWEIFGTPEYDGGVPGPTDYVTLIAEFEAVPASWSANQSGPLGKVWVAPESLRTWLSPRSKALFARAKSGDIDLRGDPNCHPYVGHVRKSGRPVQGFSCHHDGHVLVYLTLSEPEG
jgi:hypothetical protein